MPTQDTRFANACLAALIVLQLVMLGALFAQSAPHPPATISLFAIAPFLATSMSVAFAAILAGPLETRTGCILSIGASVIALLSYGPQKYFDAQFELIWPAVIAGQVAAVTLIWLVTLAVFRKKTA